ncbi:MAG: molybdopterin dinucleotide binding domain-containing protein, partial [Aeromicrobium sp.]
AQVEHASGLSRAQITEAAEMIRASRKTIYCWAMGLTQHRNAVATIKEVCNLAFARGDIGKPGAGLFPIRGHSNVQGDRTMGIWERPPETFLDSLQAEFGFDPPREHGLDTVDSIRAMRDGKAHIFVALGGNFVQAAPDTVVTSEALQNTRLTVQISTKLNRSHLRCGETALILPTLGRTEKDVRGGKEQFISVEDSVCSVHASRGVLEPASPHLRSETAIVTGIAEAVLCDRYGLRWAAMRDDYDVVRDHISRVVAGCEEYTAKVDRPGGFVLPHPPRDTRTFATKSGSAEFVVSPIEVLHVPDGHVLLQTLRSHDQFNTTIYGLSDRYRGIEGGRRVIFMHPDDIAYLGFKAGDLVDLIARWDDDDIDRVAEDFRIVPYDTPRGSAAAYYPETNPLIPLDSTAEGSNTPTSKSVIISLTPAEQGRRRTGSYDTQQPTGSDNGHKKSPQPVHLS